MRLKGVMKEGGKVQKEDMDDKEEKNAINNDNKRHMHRGCAGRKKKKRKTYIVDERREHREMTKAKAYINYVMPTYRNTLWIQHLPPLSFLPTSIKLIFPIFLRPAPRAGVPHMKRKFKIL